MPGHGVCDGRGRGSPRAGSPPLALWEPLRLGQTQVSRRSPEPVWLFVPTDRPQRPRGQLRAGPGHSLCSSLQPQWTLGWPDPEGAQGWSRAVVSAPASSLGGHQAGLTLRPGRVRAWAPGGQRSPSCFPRGEQSTPAALHGKPMPGPGRALCKQSKQRCPRAGTGPADPGLWEEAQADRQPCWTGCCPGRAGVTNIDISLHTRGRASQWLRYN